WEIISAHGTRGDDFGCVQRDRGTAAAADSHAVARRRTGGHRDRRDARARGVRHVEAPAGAAGGRAGACTGGGAAAVLRPRRGGAARGARVDGWLRALLERELRSPRGVRQGTPTRGEGR